MSSLSGNFVGDPSKSFRLNTLGGVNLVDESGRRITSVLSQPRRLAVLIFLSVEARNKPVTREKAIGLFWPDCDPQRASKSLSQAVYFLRQSLGGELFNDVGNDYLQLSAKVIQSDVGQFLNCVEDERLEEAIAMYAGAFLQGFFVSAAPDFEKWADEQTAILRRMAGSAVLELAARYLESGIHVKAVLALDKIGRIAPGDEALIKHQMEILEQAGLYGEAVESYRRLSEYLSREYECSPSDETTRVAQRIAAVAKTSVHIQDDCARLAAELRPSVHIQRRTWTPSVTTLFITALVVAALASVAALRSRSRQPTTTGGHISVVVAPIEAAPPSDAEARSLRADIVGDLSEVNGISVLLDGPNPAVRQAGGKSPLFELSGVLYAAGDERRLSLVLADAVSGAALGHTVLKYNITERGGYERTALRAADFIRIELGRVYSRANYAGLLPSAILHARSDRLTGDSLLRAGIREAALARFAAADSALTRFAAPSSARAAAFLEHAEVGLGFAWAYFLVPDSSELRTRWLDKAYSYADSALKLKRDPVGSELRGVAGYLLWQTEQPSSRFAQEANRARAESDLAAAVAAKPNLARSWSMLSSLLVAEGRFAEARTAAERAYSADSYLDETLDILQRLFFTSLETLDTLAAGRWCGEIGRRYPGGWLSQYCKLETIAWLPPDKTAWKQANRLIAEYTQRSDAVPVIAARMKMTLGVIAAKAGDRQTALRLQDQVIAGSDSAGVDELLLLRGWMWAESGMPDSALATLERYVSKSPSRRSGVLKSRRFQSLVDAKAGRTRYLRLINGR